MHLRLLLVASLCLVPIAHAGQSSKPKPIVIPTGRISTTVTGSLKTTGNAVFTLPVRVGQTVVVNAVGTSPGFQVIATVRFPGGGHDGNKGAPNFVGKVTKTGVYEITVGRNLMASSAQSGTFLLEVVAY